MRNSVKWLLGFLGVCAVVAFVVASVHEDNAYHEQKLNVEFQQFFGHGAPTTDREFEALRPIVLAKLFEARSALDALEKYNQQLWENYTSRSSPKTLEQAADAVRLIEERSVTSDEKNRAERYLEHICLTAVNENFGVEADAAMCRYTSRRGGGFL